jgi:peptide/nickel transport system ATP-binding protein
MSLLEIESLSVSYGAGPVLRELSLAVDSGDVVGLVGESGCGKTTLGWSVLGLLPENARVGGSIRFEGRDLTSMSARERRRLLGDRISIVPQAAMSSLDPMYSIGDQLVEVIRAHQRISHTRARELAVHWLREVGIPAAPARANAFPHELSGGTKQRVAIASALALNPSLLIADEPTSALDVTIQAQILGLLKALIREHAGAVLLITHDLGVVAQLCNRVAVMYAGDIVEEASVRELFADPKHPYTVKLLAAHPSAEVRGTQLATIPGSVPDPAHRPPGCSFQPRCPRAIPICSEPPPWVALEGGDRHVRCVHYGPESPAD